MFEGPVFKTTEERTWTSLKCCRDNALTLSKRFQRLFLFSPPKMSPGNSPFDRFLDHHKGYH